MALFSSAFVMPAMSCPLTKTNSSPTAKPFLSAHDSASTLSTKTGSGSKPEGANPSGPSASSATTDKCGRRRR